jgi:uncharacterized membrane protein
MERIRKAIKKTFFAGLVAVIPIVITVLALIWLFRLLDGFLSPILENMLGVRIYGLGLVVEIAVIFLVGILTTNVLGARFVKSLQGGFMRIPIVKRIYPAIQQMVEAFSPSSASSFKKVVLVEFPEKGMFSVGFLTKEVVIQGMGDQRFFSVYVPTNNLYLGHVALFKAEEVIVTGFTVEQGLKVIVSGGVAFPSIIQNQTEKPFPGIDGK